MVTKPNPKALPDCRVCAMQSPMCPVLRALEKAFQWKDLVSPAWDTDSYRLLPSDFPTKKEWAADRRRFLEEKIEQLVVGIVQAHGCDRFRVISGCKAEKVVTTATCTTCKREADCLPFELAPKFGRQSETLTFVASRLGSLRLSARDYRTEEQLLNHLELVGFELVRQAVGICAGVLECGSHEQK